MPAAPRKILILDERNGNVIEDAVQAKIDNASIVLVIQPDNHVEVRKSMGKFAYDGEFVRLPHRDEISAAKSRENDRRREAKLIEREAAGRVDSAMTKARRALGHNA